ncbi:hypothetical protein P5V34_11835 [Mycobacteroides abscessus subsp. abscessus]|uniref:hypothetical protein n=1 Tax=Mycobacteroides abscessus TaxID=36809 RepID=UPI00266C2A44|nr:hypothetical protein [Mycobacteroides abscessus]MDO3014676.1 hypothetical protein [Mycobacteroides abscessus subsp. abscessus]
MTIAPALTALLTSSQLGGGAPAARPIVGVVMVQTAMISDIGYRQNKRRVPPRRHTEGRLSPPDIKPLWW